MKHSWFCLILLLVLWSCDDREITVLEDFGFMVDLQYEGSASLLQSNRIGLEILPVNFVEGTSYTLEYYMEGASGILQLDEKTVLSEREPYELNAVEEELFFVPTSPGITTFYVSFVDSYGSTQEMELEFTTDEVDFNFSGLVVQNSLYIGESTTITFNLSQELDLPISYTLQYLFRSNMGTVWDANGNQLSSNTAIPVSPGDIVLQFESEQIGTVEMEFLLKDEFGVETMAPIRIEVEQTDFNFTVAPVKAQGDTEEQVNLNFNFELLGVEELDYSISFTSSGTGLLTSHHESILGYINNGDSQPLDKNILDLESWIGFYRGMEAGDHDVNVTITASNGISHSKSFSINFYSRPIINLVKTGRRKYNKQGCFNGCDYDWDFLIFMDVAFNEGATYKTVILTIWDARSQQYREFNLGNYSDLKDYQGYKIFSSFRDIEAGGVYNFENQTYRISVRDSNDKESDVVSGTFTNDLLDSI